MSNENQKLSDFRKAKQQFLNGARNATGNGGYLNASRMIDQELINVITLGGEAGLTQLSPELQELAEISRLIASEPVSFESWQAAMGRLVAAQVASGAGGGTQNAGETVLPATMTVDPSSSSQPVRHSIKINLSKASATSSVGQNKSAPAPTMSNGADPTSRGSDTAPAPTPAPTPAPAPTPTPLSRDAAPAPTLSTDTPSANDMGYAPTRIDAAPRPTTGGKSIEALEILGVKRKRSSTTTEGKEDEAYEDEGVEDVEMDDVEMEGTDDDHRVITPAPRQRRRTRRKSRVVSAATVSSDGEAPATPAPKKKRKKTKDAGEKLEPGWKTFPSPDPCIPCTLAGAACRSYVKRSFGHKRNACSRCHNLKRKCDLTSKRRGTRSTSRARSRSRKTGTTEEEDGEEDEDEDEDDEIEDEDEDEEDELGEEEEKKDEPAKQKGKGKARSSGRAKSESRKGKGKSRESSEKRQMKMEEDEDEWLAMQQDEPGPSAGTIRRPRQRQGDIAAIYTRIAELEAHTRTLEEATGSHVREVRQDVDRLESNAATQKKFFAQQLALVDAKAQTALDHSESNQEQLDNVRQQTRDMHQSLSSMHKHTETLTKGLKDVMANFQKMNFDLPTVFDDWLTLKLGRIGQHDEAGPSTVSSEQLHQAPWQFPSSHSHIPPMPTIQPLHNSYQPQRAPEPTSTGDAAHAPSIHSDPESITDLYPKFIHTSQEDLLVDMAGHRRVDSGEVTDGSISAEIRASFEASGERQVAAVACETDAEPEVQATKVQEAESETMASGEPGEIIEERVPEDMDSREDGVGSDQPPLEQRSPLPLGEGEGEGLESVVHSATGELHPGSTPLPLPEAAHDIAPPAVPDPPPSPATPSIIRHHSVEPPEGLLATTTFRVSPPSSQPTMPSPSPLPTGNRLTVHAPRDPAPSTDSLAPGPVTRSRSRSRSPSHFPSVTTSHTPTRKGKGKARK